MVDQAEEKKTIEDAVKEAKNILNGKQADSETCLELAVKLINNDKFSWARRLLDNVMERGIDPAGLRTRIVQKRVLATYKDTDLNRNQALDRAIDILERELDLANTSVHETLGLAGAVYKRKWEVDANKSNLERSLRYYRRGYEAGLEKDDGYTAINAAYILELLAYLEEKDTVETGGIAKTVANRREEAGGIRKHIIEYLGKIIGEVGQQALKKDDYWKVMTLAEAYFGLPNYNKAGKWLDEARKIEGISEWEYATSAKQLTHLTQLQTGLDLAGPELEQTTAWTTLVGFLGNNADALRTLYQGKLGLALSGGGFRASLYHIGVLAKLAELDLLRHVEVLSCVSGGSIVGAHYYLELRRMFQVDEKKDPDIKRDDYVGLIESIVTDFTAGVQENPRVRILANPWSNLKMIIFPSYSRTQRLGELYESLIYKRVKDGEGERKRWLTDLYINPPEKSNGFVPGKHNWSRRNKVPELVLNATTLNTGHNWQFTASWMGESPLGIDSDVDANDRYRRMYYWEAPENYRKVRLGEAVGASSCVPGLFEPIIMNKLYPDATVRLVDGGVYDNQGVASLLEQDCNVIIASDCSGQLNTVDDPGGGMMKPLLRTNSTLMQRVRSAQYQDLKARKRSSLLKGFVYMHLKQGLAGETIDWIDCEEPPESAVEQPSILTPFGIRKDIQELLSGVRTDLDSFTDIEAYALMTSGYRTTEWAIKGLGGFPMFKGTSPDWKFLKVEPEMKEKAGNEDKYYKLRSHLEVSPMLFFKVWKLSRPLTTSAILLGVAVLGSIAYAWQTFPHWKPFAYPFQYLGDVLTLDRIIVTILLICVSYALISLFGNVAKFIIRGVKFRQALHRVMVGVGFVTIGWVGAFIHLRFFDSIFKSLGRVK